MQEHRDTEQAHTKYLEVEEGYQHQLEPLDKESHKVMEEHNRLRAEFKQKESD